MEFLKAAALCDVSVVRNAPLDIVEAFSPELAAFETMNPEELLIDVSSDEDNVPSVDLRLRRIRLGVVRDKNVRDREFISSARQEQLRAESERRVQQIIADRASSSPLPASRDEISDAAAVKIQALQRGHAIRKTLAATQERLQADPYFAMKAVDELEGRVAGPVRDSIIAMYSHVAGSETGELLSSRPPPPDISPPRPAPPATDEISEEQKRIWWGPLVDREKAKAAAKAAAEANGSNSASASSPVLGSDSQSDPHVPASLAPPAADAPLLAMVAAQRLHASRLDSLRVACADFERRMTAAVAAHGTGRVSAGPYDVRASTSKGRRSNRGGGADNGVGGSGGPVWRVVVSPGTGPKAVRVATAEAPPDPLANLTTPPSGSPSSAPAAYTSARVSASSHGGSGGGGGLRGPTITSSSSFSASRDSSTPSSPGQFARVVPGLGVVSLTDTPTPEPGGSCFSPSPSRHFRGSSQQHHVDSFTPSASPHGSLSSSWSYAHHLDVLHPPRLSAFTASATSGRFPGKVKRPAVVFGSGSEPFPGSALPSLANVRLS